MNNLAKRNFAITRLNNAVDMGLSNHSVLELACEVAFYAQLVDHEIRATVQDMEQGTDLVNERTMEKLLLEPYKLTADALDEQGFTTGGCFKLDDLKADKEHCERDL